MNVVVRSDDNGETWSAPEVVPDYGWTGVESTCLTELPGGRIMVNQWRGEWHPLGLANAMKGRTDLAFPFDIGGSWAQSPEFEGMPKLSEELEKSFPWARGSGSTYAHFSSDDGRSFPETVKIETAPFCGGYANRGGVCLPDGRILVPFSDVYNFRDVFLMESQDGGASWAEPKLLASIEGSEFEEPALIRCASGKLLMVLRDNGRRVLHKIVSHDDGRSWTAPEPIGITGYPAHLLTLSDNRLLMTYGWRYPDFGIQAVVSQDEGESWSTEPIRIRDRMGSPNLGYPVTLQLPDGELLTIYYGEDEDDVTVIFGTKWRI